MTGGMYHSSHSGVRAKPKLLYLALQRNIKQQPKVEHSKKVFSVGL
jgi:hypothetical protein